MSLDFSRIFTSSLAIGFVVLGAVGCEQSSSPSVESTSQPVAAEPGRHPHDGVGAPGASPHGASPPGASPHGVSPHGAPPQGANPSGMAPGGAMPELAITWTKPADWKEMPKQSMMRAATYQAEGADGVAEVAVFYFGPGQGGDVEANITRWVGQFQDTASDAVTRSTRDVNGLKQYLVKVSEGTFASGMPGGPVGPQKAWGMEAAVVETPSGSYFFKMTGPAKTVSQQSAAFHALLSSIKTKG